MQFFLCNVRKSLNFWQGKIFFTADISILIQIVIELNDDYDWASGLLCAHYCYSVHETLP